MTRLSPFAFAAAIAATSISVLASAPAHAATAHVRYADLDLSTTSGRAMLDRRINSAARTVCWIENGDVHGIEACRHESVTNARAQRDRAVQAPTTELASR